MKTVGARVDGKMVPACDDFGRIGLAENEGSIFIEPQACDGMAVADGRCSGARFRSASIWRRRTALFWQQPPSANITYIWAKSRPIHRYKENAGYFRHSNPWIMVAENIGWAWRQSVPIITRINPSARKRSAMHRCEPYVYAQMIAGMMRRRMAKPRIPWLTDGGMELQRDYTLDSGYSGRITMACKSSPSSLPLGTALPPVANCQGAVYNISAPRWSGKYGCAQRQWPVNCRHRCLWRRPVRRFQSMLRSSWHRSTATAECFASIDLRSFW